MDGTRSVLIVILLTMASGEITIIISAIQHLYIMWSIDRVLLCQSGCQATLRRPLVQLQQTCSTGGQRQRRPHCQNQAQTFTTHRCGKISHFIIIRMSYLGRLQHDPS